MLHPLKSVYFCQVLPGTLSSVRAINEHNPDHAFTAALDDENNVVVLVPKQKPGRPSPGRWRIPMHMISAYQMAAKSKIEDEPGT
jgi:hypothetical protein